MHDVVLLEKWAQTNCNNNFYDVLLQNKQNHIIHSYLHNKRDRELEAKIIIIIIIIVIMPHPEKRRQAFGHIKRQMRANNKIAPVHS